MIQLYGTRTSPFVRRVRYVLFRLGLEYELIDTATEEGQKSLRMKTPLWKIPYLEWDGVGIWDSHTIMDYLFHKVGYGSIPKPKEEKQWEFAKIYHAIDTALESGIQLFYLSKEGASSDRFPYLKKQESRIGSILEWLKDQLNGNFFLGETQFGILELALYTSLDWFQFRSVYPVTRDSHWREFLESHSQDPHLQSTKPQDPK